MAKIVIFLVLLSSTSLVFGQSSKDLTLDSGVKPHAGLDAVYAKFSRAYRELDHELVGGLYSTDASYLVPDQDILIGRDRSHRRSRASSTMFGIGKDGWRSASE